VRQFSIATDIAAAPERVWSVMRDIERWHEWTSTVRSIRQRNSGPLAVGVRAIVRQPKFPPALWTVSELVENRGFTWISRGPGFSVLARHGVEPIEGGTRATLSLEFTGPLGGAFGWMTRSINTRYLAIEAAGLKQRSEGHAHR
jgi:hypothetical protein